MTQRQRHPLDPPLSTESAPTREQLLALAGVNSTPQPWRFIPAVSAALSRDPDDHLLRLLLAANLARLALRTPALEQTERLLATRDLSAPIADQTRAVDGAARALPEGTIGADRRIARVERALPALAERRAIDPGTLPLDEWRDRMARQEWFVTSDRNIVRRDATSGRWIRFANDRAFAAALPVGRGASGAIDPAQPVYLVGIDLPWLLMRIADLLPRTSDGWWTPILVVEPDPAAFLDGLASADRVDVFGQERLRLFVGPDAFQQLGTHLDERVAFWIGGGCFTARPERQDLGERLARAVGAACARQSEEASACRDRLRARHESRAGSYWSERYNGAHPRVETGPLRVLIQTTRFSTYVQHAAADAAAAFERIGCEARLLIEPDDSTKLSSVAFLQEAERFDPDLVVLVNYTRSVLARDLPRNVPLLTWVQDAMFHLFHEAAWRDFGPNDLVYGHLHRDFFDRFGIPRAHTRPAFVPASERKFHDGPISPDLARAFACDIAFVSNHSETPEALFERYLLDARVNPAARRVVEAVEGKVRAVVADAMNGRLLARLAGAARETLVGLNLPSDAASTARLLDQVVYPLADRLLRHEAVGWAADLAERNAWTLRIYGNGWDTHPRFSKYAAGTLPHGEELRAAYQAAAVNLHVSLHGHQHQRVVECALSGGLPIARRTGDTINLLRKHTLGVMSRDNEPSHCLVRNRSPWCFIAEHPEAMRFAAQLQRLGLKARRRMYFAERAREEGPASRILDAEVAWLMGDLAETTFDSRQSLETLVARAIESPEWRSSLSHGIAGRARNRLTYTAAAREVLDLAKSVLNRGSLDRARCEGSIPLGVAS